MGKFALLALALLVTSACKAPEESHSKAIIGAVLIDGSGGPPLTNSMVVMAGRPHPRSRSGLHHTDSGASRQNQWRRPGSGARAGQRWHPTSRAATKPPLSKRARPEQPAIGRIATLADAEWMLDHGATAFVGMIRDTETLNPDFLAKLRDLRITFAPALTLADTGREIAVRNTLRLFQAGVPIALPATAPTRCARPNNWWQPASRRSM